MTLTPRSSSTRRLLRPALATIALTSLGLLAACGGSDATSATTQTAPPTATASIPAEQGGGPMSRGTSGLVADVSGSTAQVQTSSDGQVAVTWNASTTFTAQASATLAAVKVGSCVMVSPAEAADGGDSSTVAAGSVRVIAAAGDGSCDLGFGQRRGERGPGQPPAGAPSGMPSDMPSDMPSMAPGERPSGAPSGGPGGPGGRGGFGTFGTVTAISGSGFTLESVMPPMPPMRGSDDAADSTDSTATPQTAISVTVSGSTTYTATKKSSATALEPGVCVSAMGEADDTGAVTATSIAVSPAVDGACTRGGAW